MKTKLLIAAVMFFALAVAAQAQTSFQVSSIPVTTVASCGASELTGDIIFTAISGSNNAGTGTITVTYPVGVNVALLGSVIKIFAGAGPVPVESVADEALVTASGNTLTVPISEATTSTTVIRISGVRVNVAGAVTPGSPVLVNVTSSGTTGFAFVGGQTNLVVISNVQPAFKAFGSALAGFSNATAVSVAAFNAAVTGTNPVVINIKENFNTAFQNGINGQLVQLTFSAIPAGLQLTLPVSVTTTSATPGGGGDGYQLATVSGSGNTFAVTNSAAVATLNSTSASLVVYYHLTTPSATSGNFSDTLSIPVTVGTIAVPTFPIPLGSVSVTVALAPVDTSVLKNMSYVPRYGSDQCAIGPATILNVVSARTALMMPYALFSSTPAYNTGIAIANTTTDAGDLNMGFALGTTATPQTGAIKFYFFPQTGITGPSAFSTSTAPSSTPGGGFTAGTGFIASGSTYVVNLSELLSAAGFTGSFWQGYIIAVCDFTNGHGQYFIGNAGAASGVFEQGALMLVLSPPFTVNLGTGSTTFGGRTAQSGPEQLVH